MDSTLTQLGQGGIDSGTYAGLNLTLVQIAATVFTGSSFSAVTFKQASWTGCTFTSCHFSACDFDSLAVNQCVFTGCTFSRSSFKNSRFGRCQFRQCIWDGLNFDFAQWRDVAVLDCTGTWIDGERLRGERVDFTGSHFEHLALNNAHIN